MYPNDSAETTAESENRFDDVVDHPYRYRVLVALTRDDPAASISIGATDSESPSDEPDVLRRRLYDDHLPKLDDAELINWDRETGTITRGPRFDEMQE